MLTNKTNRGFTIVELLIVIVVIAILAAITIVAYNGITNSSRDSQNRTDAASLVKVAEAVNADKGYYPGGTGDATTVTTTATLITSMNQSGTTNIPSGVTVTYLASSGTAPTFATAKTNSEASPRNFTVKVCGGTTGVTVYYPVRAGSTVGTASAGTGC